jgi:hypothetical protein
MCVCVCGGGGAGGGGRWQVAVAGARAGAGAAAAEAQRQRTRATGSRLAPPACPRLPVPPCTHTLTHRCGQHCCRCLPAPSHTQQIQRTRARARTLHVVAEHLAAPASRVLVRILLRGLHTGRLPHGHVLVVHLLHTAATAAAADADAAYAGCCRSNRVVRHLTDGRGGGDCQPPSAGSLVLSARWLPQPGWVLQGPADALQTAGRHVLKLSHTIKSQQDER